MIASRPPGPRGPALCHLPSHRRLHVVLEGETHDPAGAHNDQSCASGGHSPAILRSSRSAATCVLAADQSQSLSVIGMLGHQVPYRRVCTRRISSQARQPGAHIGQLCVYRARHSLVSADSCQAPGRGFQGRSDGQRSISAAKRPSGASAKGARPGCCYAQRGPGCALARGRAVHQVAGHRAGIGSSRVRGRDEPCERLGRRRAVAVTRGRGRVLMRTSERTRG